MQIAHSLSCLPYTYLNAYRHHPSIIIVTYHNTQPPASTIPSRLLP